MDGLIRRLKLSGSIDMVFELLTEVFRFMTGNVVKKLFTNHISQNLLLPIVSNIYRFNFWHYSMQLNIYRGILERKYGKKISGLYLVCLHPNNMNKSYDVEVPFLDKEIEDLFSYRRSQIS